MLNLDLTSPIDRLVLTGGTAEYLSRLLPEHWPAVAEDIESVLRTTSELNSSDLAEMAGCSQARARFLPAGIAIALAAAQVTDPIGIFGAPSGIRTGLLIAVFAGEL